jgi:hypothetical protein
MHELHELKGKLIDELKDLSHKELSGSSLQTIDTLAHAAKNLCKIIESSEQEGYSEDGNGGGNAGRRGFYDGGNANRRGMYDGGNSSAGYARRRNSMGRYSREGSYYGADDEFTGKLQELMDQAPDEKTRSEIQKLMSKMESM